MEQSQRIVTSTSTILEINAGLNNSSDMTGFVYSKYLNQYFSFTTSIEMIHIFEDIFDEVNFLKSYTKTNSFFKRMTVKNKKRMGESMPKEFEQGAKFIIQVKFRQNATWQGTICWVEKNKTQNFRSELEMIKLMDEAISSGSSSEDKVSFMDGDDDIDLVSNA